MGTKTVEYGLAVIESPASLGSTIRERVSRIVAPTFVRTEGELCPMGSAAQGSARGSQGQKQRLSQVSDLRFAGRPAGVRGYVSGGIQNYTDISMAWFVKTHQGSGVADGTG